MGIDFGEILRRIGQGAQNVVQKLIPSQTTTVYANGQMQDSPMNFGQVQQNVAPVPTYAPNTTSGGADYSGLPKNQGYMPKTLNDVQQTASNPGFQLTVPGQNGQPLKLPQDIAQAIGNVFEPSKTATEAASVLVHPMQETRTPEELKRLGSSMNVGENAGFRTNAENKNSNGSVDRGLFQVNSDTFNGMSKDPFWSRQMADAGIASWDDMLDPQKNAAMAKLILSRGNWDPNMQTMKNDPSWSQWYAAPRDLRMR